jgi:hypothetical protein
MPAKAKKTATKKTATKKATTKKATTKKAATKKTATKKTATKKTATKKAATKKAATKKTATKKTATKKTATKKTATNKTATKRAPTKPIRLDYLTEKLAEAQGNADAIPPLHDNLDVVIFFQLARAMPLAEARKAFQALRTQFVDWNEVRISPAEEVEGVLKSAASPERAARFLQRFLMKLFLEHHHVGLEFLREKTNPEIKAFFKKVPEIADSTLGILLERVNEYPVVPLEATASPFLERVGIGKPNATFLARQKMLYESVPREQVLGLSLLIQDHAEHVCPPEEEAIDCPDCALKRGCPFPAKVTPRQRASAKKKGKKSK